MHPLNDTLAQETWCSVDMLTCIRQLVFCGLTVYYNRIKQTCKYILKVLYSVYLIIYDMLHQLRRRYRDWYGIIATTLCNEFLLFIHNLIRTRHLLITETTPLLLLAIILFRRSRPNTPLNKAVIIQSLSSPRTHRLVGTLSTQLLQRPQD